MKKENMMEVRPLKIRIAEELDKFSSYTERFEKAMKIAEDGKQDFYCSQFERKLLSYVQICSRESLAFIDKVCNISEKDIERFADFSSVCSCLKKICEISYNKIDKALGGYYNCLAYGYVDGYLQEDLSKLVEKEDPHHKMFCCTDTFKKRHDQMIDQIFNDFEPTVSPFILLEK